VVALFYGLQELLVDKRFARDRPMLVGRKPDVKWVVLLDPCNKVIQMHFVEII